MRASSTMRGVSHTVRAGGARLSTGSRTTAAQDSVLELPRQRGRHPALFLPSKRHRGRIPARRALLSLQERQGSSADR